jgi:aryl-alcohol dehydrogenase-like predicted oxidoreductase
VEQEELSRKSNDMGRLIIGTAQLGMNYGVANRTYLDHAQKLAFLRRARAANLTYFDTARAYGNSENVLGDFMRTEGFLDCAVVTKLAPLTELEADSAASRVAEAVRTSVAQSLSALGLARLGTLLLHRAQHLDAWQGVVWETLLRLREDGQIGVLGVSAQTPAEVIRALEDDDVGYVQMPFSLLDHRWDPAIAAIERKRTYHPLKVAVRSIYLQGLLLSNDHAVWHRAHVKDSSGAIGWLRKLAADFDRSGIDDLCLAYVAAQHWIDGIVVGMDNEEQLIRNLDLMSRPALSEANVMRVHAERPYVGADTLDPSKWVRDL